MAVQKTTIIQFLELAQHHPVLDVRSPGEYDHAHIPAAFSLPLFTDEERKIVGTAYKQDSRQIAIKAGLDFFGPKMRRMVEEVESLLKSRQPIKELESETGNGKLKTENQIVLVHCWRGGMRSAGVAWLLDLYGFKVYTLTGGYKAYRRWVQEQFEKLYPINIIGGYTGSGKTLVLHELMREGEAVIDLERLANHKGSAFGALGQKPQPSQEMFENLLATALFSTGKKFALAKAITLVDDTDLLTMNDAGNGQNPLVIYLEDESQRIGNLIIPNSFWKTMRNSPICFLDIPFEERLNYLTEEYGRFEKEGLLDAVTRIQKRLGGLQTKKAINFLLENDYKECFRILLTYYDKWYGKGLLNRENLPALLNKISCNEIDVKSITKILTNEKTVAL